MAELNNKVVIITGASSGIGQATAEKLAGEGAKVVLASRREDRLEKLASQIKGNGGDATYKVTDVTELEQVEALAQHAIDTYGSIDVLFNNAGIMPLSFMDKLKLDEWEKMVDVNIKGVLYGVKAVLPHMLDKNSGHVITTSSVAGHEVMPSSAVYSGTKYAVRVMMEGMNKDLAKTNIRTTSISPGAVATELTDQITDDDVLSMFGKQEMTPLNSEDIAEAVYYAVSQPDNVDVNEIIVRPKQQG